jgi:hypothetical protein
MLLSFAPLLCSATVLRADRSSVCEKSEIQACIVVIHSIIQKAENLCFGTRVQIIPQNASLWVVSVGCGICLRIPHEKLAGLY